MVPYRSWFGLVYPLPNTLAPASPVHSPCKKLLSFLSLQPSGFLWCHLQALLARTEPSPCVQGDYFPKRSSNRVETFSPLLLAASYSLAPCFFLGAPYFLSIQLLFFSQVAEPPFNPLFTFTKSYFLFWWLLCSCFMLNPKYGCLQRFPSTSQNLGISLPAIISICCCCVWLYPYSWVVLFTEIFE